MPDSILSLSAAKRGSGGSTGMLPGLLVKTAVFALLWWLITQGAVQAWLVGLPAVALAVLAATRLDHAAMPRISLRGLAAFLLLFLRESIRGGLDVARRVLAPALRIKPGFVHYRTQLMDPRARVLLVSCISLLPGTLAAHLEQDRLDIHLLDLDVDPEFGLRQLEQSIAGVFPQDMENTDD